MKRATLPPMGLPAPLSRMLVAFLWLIPVVFFGYFTLIDRWDVAERELAYLGRGPRIVVGVSVEGSASGGSDQGSRSQVYLAVPDSFRTLDAYVVAQDGDAVHVRPIRFGLVIFLGFYVAWIGASLRYLLTRIWRPTDRV